MVQPFLFFPQDIKPAKIDLAQQERCRYNAARKRSFTDFHRMIF